MKWIEEKMKVLGCDNHPDYKLAFYLDSRAMISIHADKYGVIEVRLILKKFMVYDTFMIYVVLKSNYTHLIFRLSLWE